jgi:hypothetical protein
MKELAMQQEEQTGEVAGESLSHYICLAPYRYQRGAGSKTGHLELIMHVRQVPGESEPVPSLISIPFARAPNLGDALRGLKLFTQINGTMDERYIRYGGTFIPTDMGIRYHLFFVDTTNMDLEPEQQDVTWRPLKEVFFYQDPMLYVVHAEIHAAFFHA